VGGWLEREVRVGVCLVVCCVCWASSVCCIVVLPWLLSVIVSVDADIMATYPLTPVPHTDPRYPPTHPTHSRTSTRSSTRRRSFLSPASATFAAHPALGASSTARIVPRSLGATLWPMMRTQVGVGSDLSLCAVVCVCMAVWGLNCCCRFCVAVPFFSTLS
jgi:hypothetical protein